jgi:hypothetical protein
MINSFNLIPENHFGPLVDKIYRNLVIGEPVCIYGMPGFGRKHLLKLIQLKYEKEYGAKNVLYFEGFGYDNEDVRTIIQNSLIQKLHFDKKQDFFIQLNDYLGKNKLLIVISYFEALINNEKLMSFLLKVKKFSFDNFSVLSSSDQSILSQSDLFLRNAGDLVTNQIKVPLFDLEGTIRMLKINREMFGFNYPESCFEKIYELTNGNPALVRYVGKCVDDMGELVLTNINVMLKYPPLKLKLNNIVEAIIKEPIEILRQVDIINNDNSLFSPLVREYLKIYELENMSNLLPDLRKGERKILSFLVKNRGQIVDKDRIAFLMGLTESNFSLWAIYKTISRLKIKIKGKYELRVIKDKGYILS